MILNGYKYYFSNIIAIFGNRKFQGWGRKRSGRFATYCHKIFGGSIELHEDGFIRSIDLGMNTNLNYSIVKDNIGIYYDATKPSNLEYILNTYNFKSNKPLMKNAEEAIQRIIEFNISKYNYAKDIKKTFFAEDRKRKVLVIAQVMNDMSLKYGEANQYHTDEMINDAITRYPKYSIYVKVHPDVLFGTKVSDINLDKIPQRCTIINEDVNAISLLKFFDVIYTKTSGMGMEALLLKKKVYCYGMPYYAGWGLTVDKHQNYRRNRTLTIEELFAASYILYPTYYNPYAKKNSDIFETIRSIVKYKKIYQLYSGHLFFFGFSLWKRNYLASFFSHDRNSIEYCSSLNEALDKGLNRESKIFIWGKKDFLDVENYSSKNKLMLYRVEDGFIRSVSLGSDLTQGYSLIVDNKGIYFDPTKENELENILNTTLFNANILQRARNIHTYILEHNISKYNADFDKKLDIPHSYKNSKILLVPGQVEDDASIIYGANGMTNLELIKIVRKNNPHAFIIYKPHPDVHAGNRKGEVSKDKVLKFTNMLVSEISLDSVLVCVDEVHTMTSLVGFESLLRGKIVHTYGTPFYAGWGLTTDHNLCKKRYRNIALEELIAGALVLYPQYIDPKTNNLCEIEVLLTAIEKEKQYYQTYPLYQWKEKIRNIILRKIQSLFR